MLVIILIICLLVQRFLKFSSASYQVDWVTPFYNFCFQRFYSQMTALPVLGFLLLLLPPLLLMIIIFNLVEHLVGDLGYWILVLAWCWYCLDVMDLSKYESDPDSIKGISKAYFHRVFAVSFWFLIGPLWLVLYIIVYELSRLAESQDEPSRVFAINEQLLQLMRWIPVRLFGLSMAFVSHFTQLMKLWLASLTAPLSETTNLVVKFSDSAMTAVSEPASSTGRLQMLNEYTLLVWLVVAAILRIALLL